MLLTNKNIYLYQINFKNMMLSSQILNVLELQRLRFIEKDFGLIRDIIDTIPIKENFSTIITGIRRCGKSTLMHQLMSRLNKEFIYLNFEDTRMINFDVSDFKRLSEIIDSKKCKILFFDEIQVADKWEVFVRQKLDEGYIVIITGSNATLLSKELGTTLTGRHLNIELFPFSYNEFLKFKELKPTDDSLQLYLNVGGFPEYLKNNDPLILNQLMDDILLRDIAVRYGVRDIPAMKQLAIYLISNIGKPITGNSLSKMLGIKVNSTILEYFSYFENCYLFYFLPMFSYSLKVQMRNPRKVYTIDNGLYAENSVIFSDENGRKLENAIFIHLRRKYKHLFYFKGQNECDFVCMNKNKEKILVQVCYELNDTNYNRELKGLTEAMEFFKVKKGTIVTFNQKDIILEKEKEIRIIPAYDFLME